MKPIIKLYLKTFLILGILFGLIVMLFDVLNGAEFNLSKPVQKEK